MCPRSLTPRQAHFGVSQEALAGGAPRSMGAPSAPWPCTSPVSGRRLEAGEGVPGLLLVAQESVCPGTPSVVIPLARSSPEVGSQVQGG